MNPEPLPEPAPLPKRKFSISEKKKLRRTNRNRKGAQMRAALKLLPKEVRREVTTIQQKQAATRFNDQVDRGPSEKAAARAALRETPQVHSAAEDGPAVQGLPDAMEAAPSGCPCDGAGNCPDCD